MATKAKKDFYKEYVNRMEKHGGYNNLVVLLRMGDFYETYDESAERCAAVLGLTMAETLKSDNKYHTMVGFPASKRDEYVSVMIGECYRVVVVEPDYEMVYHRDAHGKLVIIRNNNNSTTINNNQNQATMEKNFKFKSVSTVNRYMFNPEMQALVDIIRGQFGVAENACVWIPQTMKEKAVMFISENLVILLPKSQIVNNMHEAYKRIEFDKEYDGYGTFISGPSKTADIAQVLVMGAQAARSATILLLPE